mgnify:FL=1
MRIGEVTICRQKVIYSNQHNTPRKRSRYHELLALKMYFSHRALIASQNLQPLFFVQIPSAGNVNKEKKKPPIRRKRKDTEKEAFVFQRPPAIYTNRTQEEIINYYLNQDI